MSNEAKRIVRAKMRCTRRGEFTDGGKEVTGISVTLQPVYSSGPDDKANAEWSKYTPSGQLELTITNPACFDFYKVGAAYFVDMTPTGD